MIYNGSIGGTCVLGFWGMTPDIPIKELDSHLSRQGVDFEHEKVCDALTELQKE